MGWTWTHKPSNMTATEFLMRDTSWDSRPEAERPKVVASATGPGCVALAVRFPKGSPVDIFEPALDGSVTVALVFAVQYSKDDYNFGYKEMDECMGPFFNVSASFLKHLSPIKADANCSSAVNARQWRQGCLAFSATRTKANGVKKLTPGTKIKFPSPLNFGSFKESEFVVSTIVHRGKNKTVFRAQNGVYCRITGRALGQAEIVGQ